MFTLTYTPSLKDLTFLRISIVTGNMNKRPIPFCGITTGTQPKILWTRDREDKYFETQDLSSDKKDQKSKE